MIEYKTILNFGQDEFVTKKSRFIGFAMPIKTAEEAVAFVSKIKVEHRDAAHNVFAYCVRNSGLTRCTDDGEPQGTAGTPILEVIKNEEITDCVIAVTRYFGGTLLGTGGLIRAYSHAGKLAILASGIVTMTECAICEVKCDYNFYGRLSILLNECDAKIESALFEENVKVNFIIKLDELKKISDKILDLSNGSFLTKVIKKEFYAMKK